MWVTKLLISPVKKRIFCPKTTKFGPKLAFLENLGQAMKAYSVPCWWVGWWLWRAGCISQDTYLLYDLLSVFWIFWHGIIDLGIRYSEPFYHSESTFEIGSLWASRSPQVLCRVRYQKSKPNLSTFLQKVLPPISEIEPNQISILYYIQHR